MLAPSVSTVIIFLNAERFLGEAIRSVFAQSYPEWELLLVDDGSKVEVGAPYIKGAKISADLVEEGRTPKVTVIHYRAKSRYFKKRGHRQHFSKVKISL